jgi:hypothetical protein
MADRNKFEEMLEKLVNEDRAGAEELFHEIVVEKSRDIYENLLEDDLEVDEANDEEVDEATDEEVDEATDEEVDESSEEVDETKDEEVDESDEDLDENFDLDEFEVEADPMDMDSSADMAMDIGADAGEEDPMGMDDEGEAGSPEDMADDISDLQDEVEKLKAAFDAEMGGDSMDTDDDKDSEDGDDGDEEEEDAPEEESVNLGMEEATDEEVDEATDEVDESGDKSEAEQMREYVEKVSGGGLDAQKIGGDNGANAKSPVASANKMGDGTTANIVAGGEAGPGGTAGGLAGNSPKVDNMGNINVPGGKAGKAMKPMSKGHGAEKKGAGETADNKKSIVGK